MGLSKDQILSEIDSLISVGEKLIESRRSPAQVRDGLTLSKYASCITNCGTFLPWITRCSCTLKDFLPDTNDYIKKLSEILNKNESNRLSDAETCLGYLKYIKDGIYREVLSINSSNGIDINATLEMLFSRFHCVVRGLSSRYGDRKPLEIDDEYDVQYLISALLQLYFDDVRPEEWTPSYAGSCSRMDFLLKQEEIVIEIKKTRKGLKDKELGGQLIVDIEKYKMHPNCKSLICFVYDPEGKLGNPRGIENDLNSKHEGFVRVIIRP